MKFAVKSTMPSTNGTLAMLSDWMLQVQRTGTLSRPGEEAPPKIGKSGQVITRCTLRCMLQLDLFVYRSMDGLLQRGRSIGLQHLGKVGLSTIRFSGRQRGPTWI